MNEARAAADELERLAERGRRGEREALGRLAAGLGPERAIAWLAIPEHTRAPDPDALDSLAADASPDVIAAASVGAPDLARAAILRGDEATLRAVAERAGGSETSAAREVDRLRFGAARAWADLGLGQTASDWDVRVERLASEGARVPDATLRLEVALLRVFRALVRGEDAWTSARRCSRMARTESMAHFEYLAGLALARTRRLRGRPHLAIHILEALGRVVSWPYRAPVAWELAMAGDPKGAATLVEPIARHESILPEAVTRLLAERFGVGTVDDGGQEAGGWTFWGRDLEDIDAVFGRVERGPADVGAFRAGLAPLPERLKGLAALAARGPALERAAPGLDAAAVVWIESSGAARRVLASVLVPEDATWLATSEHCGPRTLCTLATLALTGRIDETELFHRVYGFAFDDARHRGVFDVLLHRCRSVIEGRAELERRDGTLELRCSTSIVIPDPSCTIELEDRVLRLLAEGPCSARAVSGRLGVAVRTVQKLLARLTEEGVCVRERDGRHVAYRVEDTTFQLPTKV